MTEFEERILLIGSGGREHALAWRLGQSKAVEKLFVAPGNAGTALVEKTTNIDLNVKDLQSVSKWCKENNVTFVIVGPEDPLALGIVDHLAEKGISCFGPTAAAAEIEASKDFAKQFMTRHDIPTAQFKSFTDAEAACKFINSASFEARVVKASGLAAGKGVVVATTREEACAAVKEMMTDKVFGAAGDIIVVEELLEGPEVSVLAFSDGFNVHLMPPAQDHKRLLDNDQGPNTGGMGAVCPYLGLTEGDLENVKKDVIEKTVRGMAKEGRKYVGVLYAGLMLTKEGPKVLEFNCRFGDPETQSILALMSSDLLVTLKACVKGSLSNALPTFETSMTAAGVVVVSGGYPGTYKKGIAIEGLPENMTNDLHVFHAGTKTDSEGHIVTNGGRVVAVVAKKPSLIEAIGSATLGAASVSFDGAFYRKDIGKKVLDSTALLQNKSSKGLLYKDAGVDIDAGDALVEAIKPLAKMTRRKGCAAKLGGFGGVFDLAAEGLDNAVLACATSGVGPKIEYAELQGLHYNVGHDLVANAVNSLLTRGTEPVFFLDYYACGKLVVPVAREVILGVAEACKESGCSLIGGETAEMPGIYHCGDYDVAGMAVGSSIQNGNGLLPRVEDVEPGDSIVCVMQTQGMSSGDFSLLDRILSGLNVPLSDLGGFQSEKDLSEEVLLPSKIHVAPFRELIKAGLVKSFTTITHGRTNITSKLIPEHLGLSFDTSAWTGAPVFGWLWAASKLTSEAFSMFSCLGLDAVAVVKKADEEQVIAALMKHYGDNVRVVGSVTVKCDSDSSVVFHGLEAALQSSKNVAKQACRSNFDILMKLAGQPMNKFIMAETETSCSSALMKGDHCGALVTCAGLPATFDLSTLGLSRPLLVSGTDGVGTKLKIAQVLNEHSTIGIDLVAMCVNDVLACGALPLFFTSYLATGQIQPEIQAEILKGVAEGCQQAGSAFVDEHTSNLSSLYSPNVYDLAGFSVAVVDERQALPRLNEIQPGDVLVALTSSGVHSNGFSLVRRVVEKNGFRFDMPSPFAPGVTLGHDLLKPTKIYVKSVLPAIHSGKVKSLAHITGGGLLENIPRALPDGLGVILDANNWDMPPVFGWLQCMGKIPLHEMSRTFNCGLGCVLIVAPPDVESVIASITENGESPNLVGRVVESKGQIQKVQITNLETSLTSCWTRPKYPFRKRKVGVLISGSGTNLQALIDHTQNTDSCAEIKLVISNKSGVYGLKRAERAGIPTLVINHKEYKSRSEFDSALHEALLQHGIEIVCLAGFMRILTGEFVNKWPGRMLNIHPSLLPSFKGAHAHRMVLEARVRISGCSVHFVTEEVDGGAILVQESVPVFNNDTESTLGERVKTVEHGAFPRALEMVASGQVCLGNDGKLTWNW